MNILQQLRYLARRENHVLTPALLDVMAHVGPELGADAAERAKKEYLAVADQDGSPIRPTEEVREMRLAELGDGKWVREASIEGAPVLLAARWLCHLVGLRHRTVQLFIDHPTNPAYTLVQVRSHDKAQAPSRFDIPAAGHIVGVTEPEAALITELGEELGLGPNDILGLRQIAAYEYKDPSHREAIYDIEYSLVYRCRLAEGALQSISFSDGEVAAIASFDVDELATLIAEHPERIASGLFNSFSLYKG
jgi:isopentenyldiphosphate isomerase